MHHDERHCPSLILCSINVGVPAEMVDNFDCHRPLLIGGLGPGEEKVGCMRLRFKRHRWAPRVLKTRDPLVFSVGWRRYQSLPIYAVEDHNRRLRMLKYTPEHMHRVAVAWGEMLYSCCACFSALPICKELWYCESNEILSKHIHYDDQVWLWRSTEAVHQSMDRF